MNNEYVIVDEDENIYGPFATKEEADQEAETLRNHVTGELPLITMDEKYVRKANINLQERALLSEANTSISYEEWFAENILSYEEEFKAKLLKAGFGK